MLGKGHRGLYKAPTKEVKEESERIRGEKDEIELMMSDLKEGKW